MSTALATRSSAPVAMRTDNLDTLTIARMLAESGFFGEVKDAGKALAKILAGQELGIGPIASLMGIYYQQGKVTYSANVMATAVKKHPQYDYRVRTIGTAECSIEFFERNGDGWESLGISSFTTQDADEAGLLTGPNKHNWKSYRRNMLFARAISNGCKWYCPGIFGGVTPYTPDELGAEVIVSDSGDMQPVTEAPQAVPSPSYREAIDAATPSAGWAADTLVRWDQGIRIANDIGADIPEKPAADAARSEVVAALRELGANIQRAKAERERDELEATLRDVVRAANESAEVEIFEIPDDLEAMSSDDLREMIAAAQRAIPTTEAA